MPMEVVKEFGLAAARAMVRLEFSAPENSTRGNCNQPVFGYV